MEMGMTHELIIGTYTERLPHVAGRAEGILSCRYDEGVVGTLRGLAVTNNPSYLALSGDRQYLYAVNEVATFADEAGACTTTGGVSAFRRDLATGDLSWLGTVPSGGEGPCHLCLTLDGRFLVVANYGSGSVSVFALGPDGALGKMTWRVEHVGSGPNSERQGGPHPHMVAVDPWTAALLVVDLGLDAILTYALSDEGELAERPEGRIYMRPGAGPRHLVFGPGGEHLFVVNELDNSVVALRREGRGFATVARASTLSCDSPTSPGAGASRGWGSGTGGGSGAGGAAAAVRISPSGGLVLVSNRAPEGGSVAVLRFDARDGSLELTNVQGTGGYTPRDMLITDGGRFVAVANQDSDNVVVFGLEEETGLLTEVSVRTVPTPACLLVP
jgi:6-phosphogluconolactonase